MGEQANLEWALRSLRDENRLGGYRLARRYYEGDHNLAFATDKFRSVFGTIFSAFADNLCPAVVDSISDRLRIEGVGFDEGVGGTQELADRAWEIWQRNRMDVRAPEVHHEGLLTGDGYALVWPDQAGEAVIWPIAAEEMVVLYDPNVPGKLLRAARTWQDVENYVHVDLYLEDRVERYVTRNPKRNSMAASWTYREFVPYVGENDLAGEGVFPHTGGRVPVVHFPNRRYHWSGVSELAPVVPLQDALNKAICDMLVAMEFAAYPQRWATGIEAGELDEQGRPKAPPFDYGVDRMLTAPLPESRFGAFPASDLRMYVEVQENLRAEIARVSGTPLHYLFITKGDYPSGEAMKSAEARFTRKVEQRQEAWGNEWEDLLALALRLEGDEEVDGAMLSLEWEPAAPTAATAGEPVAPALAVPPDDARARSAAQPQ